MPHPATRRELLLALLASPVVALAQDQPPAAGGLFRRVVTAPNGKNGYEDFVRAAELCQASAAVTE